MITKSLMNSNKISRIQSLNMFFTQISDTLYHLLIGGDYEIYIFFLLQQKTIYHICSFVISRFIMSDIVVNMKPVSYESDQYVVVAENIHKTYLFGLEGVAALRGVSLKIKQGEFVIILGNSGGGKTSLLNILGTIDKLTKGNLQLFGERIKSTTPDNVLSALRLNYLGFVFQTFNLISSLTARQNVELPMILKNQLSQSQIRQRAQQLLKSVGMGHRLGHYPNQLSGGQQQRVTIARALANKPKMLLLDQPTGDLDSKNSKIVLDILTKLNQKQNITLIMVTHDVNLKFYSHRVLKVLDGKIIGEENIQPQARSQYLGKLQKQIEKIQNKEQENMQQYQELHRNQQKSVQNYGPIKWLKKKLLKEKIQMEVMRKIEEEVEKY